MVKQSQNMSKITHDWEWLVYLLFDLFWLVVWNIFYFPIYWKSLSQLTNIFQRGWNHQPVLSGDAWWCFTPSVEIQLDSPPPGGSLAQLTAWQCVLGTQDVDEALLEAAGPMIDMYWHRETQQSMYTCSYVLYIYTSHTQMQCIHA